MGQATTPLVERCPARFRVVRDEYLEACRRRGNAEASVVTKQRTADQFLAYLISLGAGWSLGYGVQQSRARTTLAEAHAAADEVRASGGSPQTLLTRIRSFLKL